MLEKKLASKSGAILFPNLKKHNEIVIILGYRYRVSKINEKYLDAEDSAKVKNSFQLLTSKLGCMDT